jgi:AcrR family transcriptional regulator
VSLTEQDLRQKIIDTAKEMLDETGDVQKITVRQIAQRAGVGIGLINYHFNSKDNLMSIAIGNAMEKTITDFNKKDDDSLITPDVKLRTLLKELCDTAGRDEKLVRFMILREITEGCMEAPLHLVPIIKEIFGEQKDDIQLRIIALQILQPLQLSGLNPAAFHMYSVVDISDPDQRNLFIDTLVDNLIASCVMEGKNTQHETL